MSSKTMVKCSVPGTKVILAMMAASSPGRRMKRGSPLSTRSAAAFKTALPVSEAEAACNDRSSAATGGSRASADDSAATSCAEPLELAAPLMSAAPKTRRLSAIGATRVRACIGGIYPADTPRPGFTTKHQRPKVSNLKTKGKDQGIIE